MNPRVITTNMHILVERQRIAVLEKELESTAAAHSPDTPWRKRREVELATRRARVTRFEQSNEASPQ